MRGIRRHLLEQVSTWDAPTRRALAIALVLLAVMFGVYVFGGAALRVPAIVGIATLFSVAQLIVLWGNRRMVTPFTQAQRLYLNGDIESARELLAARRTAPDVDVQELTLLGNIERQLGDLPGSEAILLEALHISPQHHFPLYGLGRTQLAQGRYAVAVGTLQQALANAAPPVIHADLAEAYYRQGQRENVQAALKQLELEGDAPLQPYRQLMTQFIRHQLDAGDLPTAEVIAAGLPYWEATAQRFAGTPYGAAVAQDIQTIRSWNRGV